MAGSADLKCPSPFVSLDASTCVMQCPTDRQFVRTTGTNGPQCTYMLDPSKASIPLVTVGAVAFNGTNMDELRRERPDKFNEFLSERDRFRAAWIVAYGNLDKNQLIQDAFKGLQRAENVRDQSPTAYQAARTAYYTLVKGASWINEERERISKAEVAPEAQKYRDAVAAVNVRTREQQKTIDVVNGIKDKVLSLKDDFKYSVSTFSDQLEKVKIQLNMENRSRAKQEKDDTWLWIDLGLNILLVAVLVYAVYTFVRRYFLSHHSPFPTPFAIQPAAPPGQIR